jgi:hypothetical protein
MLLLSRIVRIIMAGTGWSTDETQALIEIWNNEKVQAKL